MRKFLSVFVMSVIVISFSVLGFAQNQPPKKVYIVYLTDSQVTSFVLQDVEASDFNGVKCLKGTHVGAGWALNKTVYIPVDRVSEIIEEDSLDQYKADTATPAK